MKHFKLIISIIIVILWLLVIFVFSSMNENTSHIQSQKVVQKIYTNKQTVENNKIIKKNKYDQKIRKIAHVTEFAILNIFFINLIYQLKEKFKLKYLIISIILTFIYSFTYEIHQIFVQSITSSFIDLLIHTT